MRVADLLLRGAGGERVTALVQDDELSWCAQGAGRMLRAPTVFEDVVKTT